MRAQAVAITLSIALIALIAMSSPGRAAPPADAPGAPEDAISTRLDAIGRSPSPQRIEADIRKLVSFGTRHTLSDTNSKTRGIGAATRWIFDEFTRISKACGGCLEVRYVRGMAKAGEPRIPRDTEIVNVIAIQRGGADPNRYAIMSGDIDSRVSDVMDASSDSPGANDNASGIAGTLEAARVLSKQKFPGSIVYAALAGEEQGLYGGRILAEHAKANGWRVVGVLNNDMIGNSSGIDGITDTRSARVFSEGTRANETAEEARQRRFSGGEVDSPSRNLARYIKAQASHVPDLEVMLVYRLDRFGRGGHHRPFNDAGYPAVRLMETHEHYDRQHQDLRSETAADGSRRVYGDTVDGVDFTYAAKLIALDAVTLAALAAAPPPPAAVKIEGAVSADTTLSWQRPTGAQAQGLAGYRVYWRATDEARWSHSVYVGDVDSYTLENIVIDNWFFGVAAVGRDGSESPVVFPGAAGSFGGY